MASPGMPAVLANVASSVFMAGMIWTVQVVHYPLFEQVGEGTFVAYMAEHQRRITLVILLPWAIEGVSSLWLVANPPEGVGRALPLAGLAAAGVAVLATVGLAVPEHTRLTGGLDVDAVRRLVGTNWIRTAAWSAHAGIALWIAARAVRRA